MMDLIPVMFPSTHPPMLIPTIMHTHARLRIQRSRLWNFL